MKRSKVAPKGSSDAAVTEIAELVEAARRRAARSVNAVMTAVYWSIGRRIVLEIRQTLSGELDDLAAISKHLPLP